MAPLINQIFKSLKSLQMKLILSLLLAGGLFFTCSAQSLLSEVIGSAGDYSESSSGSNLHWTVGEIAISNYEQENTILSEGFHQTYLDDYINAVWESPENNFSISVLPNPAQNWIIIDSEHPDQLQFNIFNLNGQKLISAQTVANGKKEVNIQNLPAGMYLISISEDGRLLKNFKVIKQ